MPKYVVLHHCEHPAKPDHWDFMLEDGGVLLTFALPECPAEFQRPATCERLPAHRLHYLEYEGPVSGDRGRVSRWDRGKFQFLTKSSEMLRGELSGEVLCGVFEIRITEQAATFAYSANADSAAPSGPNCQSGG